MTSLAKEKHPAYAPIPVAQLPAFVAVGEQDFKTKPKEVRDLRGDELRAQLFWHNVAHTDRMTLPTLEKLLRQAVEGGKVSSPRVDSCSVLIHIMSSVRRMRRESKSLSAGKVKQSNRTKRQSRMV
jgi:hypothetical protein